MRFRGVGGRAGFTLLETAVTIVIMGVVALAGYEAFATLIDQRARIRAATTETERAAALREMLEDWFERSYLAGPQTADNGRGGWTTSGVSKDMFGFVTRAPTPSRSWATVMLLFIDDNPSTPEQGLTLRYIGYSSGESAPWITFSNTQPAEAQDAQLRRMNRMPVARELDRRVVGLRVEYLDPQTHRWRQSKDAAAGGGQWMAVRLTLEGAPGAPPLPPLLGLPFLISKADMGQR